MGNGTWARKFGGWDGFMEAFSWEFVLFARIYVSIWHGQFVEEGS